MKGAIVVNGYYKSNSYKKQVERFSEELIKNGVDFFVMENSSPISERTEFPFDFALFLDKDVVLAMLMESKGVRVFNCAECLENTDSKGKTVAVLSKIKEIKQQKTIFIPKRYFYVFDEKFLRNVERELSYPLVAKESRGSLGEQVYLINNFEELRSVDEKIGTKEGIYQEFRKESAGISLRIIVIGGKAVGGMELFDESDFRSNAHQGGQGTPVELKKEWADTAELAAQTLKADYAGVDMFCDAPVVIEVNGNAFFCEFEEKTGINVAGTYIKYIIDEMKE